LLLILGLGGAILASGLSNIIPTTEAIVNAASQLRVTFSRATDFVVELVIFMFEWLGVFSEVFGILGIMYLSKGDQDRVVMNDG
jgi:hypothetical protein